MPAPAPIVSVLILAAPKNKYGMGSKGTKLRAPYKRKTSNINPKDSLYFRDKNMGKTKQIPSNKQLAEKVKHMIKPSKQPRKIRTKLM